MDLSGWSIVVVQPELEAFHLVEEWTGLAYDPGILSWGPDLDHMENRASRFKLADFSLDDRDSGGASADDASGLSLNIVTDTVKQDVRATANILFLWRLDLVGCR